MWVEIEDAYGKHFVNLHQIADITYGEDFVQIHLGMGRVIELYDDKMEQWPPLKRFLQRLRQPSNDA